MRKPVCALLMLALSACTPNAKKSSPPEPLTLEKFGQVEAFTVESELGQAQVFDFSKSLRPVSCQEGKYWEKMPEELQVGATSVEISESEFLVNRIETKLTEKSDTSYRLVKKVLHSQMQHPLYQGAYYQIGAEAEELCYLKANGESKSWTCEDTKDFPLDSKLQETIRRLQQQGNPDVETSCSWEQDEARAGEEETKSFKGTYRLANGQVVSALMTKSKRPQIEVCKGKNDVEISRSPIMSFNVRIEAQGVVALARGSSYLCMANTVFSQSQIQRGSGLIEDRFTSRIE